MSNQGQGAPDPTDTPYNREMIAAHEDVRRRALERYVFELVKGWAEAGNRVWQEHGMEDPYGVEIREVKLEGEYPDAVIKLRTYGRGVNPQGGWVGYSPWKILEAAPNAGYGEADRMNAERIAGDILMWARGG